MNNFKSLFNNKKFLYLWISQITSQVTINILNFLFLIRLFAQTKSTIATSLLWTTVALPAIIVGPIASAYVDMADRKKILIITNLLQSLTVLIYAFIFKDRLFLLYGIVFVYSFLNQFYVPAEAASLPSLVKKESYSTANALFFLTQQTALIIGFAFAGLLKQIVGFEYSLFICAGLLFVAFISVIFLPESKINKKIPDNFEVAFFDFFKKIIDGYKFIRNTKSIVLPFILLLTFQASLAVVVINIPLIATEIFKISVDASAHLIIVPAGIGAALAAYSVPIFLKSGMRKKKLTDIFLGVISFSLFLLTFIVPEITNNWRLVTGVISVIAIGYSFAGIVITSQTTLQENTPHDYRGRVFGNFWFLVTIVSIFPVIFSGAISELFGIKLLMLVLTSITIAGLLISKKKGEQLLNNNLKLES